MQRCGYMLAHCTVRMLQVTTEKMIRKQLEEQLGIDLGNRKSFIREQARLFHMCVLLGWLASHLYFLLVRQCTSHM